MASSPSDEMNPSDAVVSAGTVLGDRYEVIEEIGRGGFGRILRAKQINVNRDVAVKVLPPKFTAMSDVVERFKREARLASQLQHPNTVTLHDYGQHEELLFIVLELLEGRDLGHVLRRKPKLEPKLAQKIGVQSLKSLSEAHRKGIIHRDLKPENIFLAEVGDDANFVKLLDFGIAKLKNPPARQNGQDRPKLTVEGNTVGTPTYMAPEQASGGEITAQSDLYSLGIILYEIINGHPPYEDEAPADTMRSHLFDDVPEFSRESLKGSALEQVVLTSIAKDKEDRFQSASAFLEALEDPELWTSDSDVDLDGEDNRERTSTQDFLTTEPERTPDSNSGREKLSSLELEPVESGEISDSVELLDDPEQRDFGTSSSVLTVVESGSDDEVIVLDEPKKKSKPRDDSPPEMPDESEPSNRQTPLSSDLDIVSEDDEIELENSSPYQSWQIIAVIFGVLALVGLGYYLTIP
jgi:serine/threonine protein kinase